MERKEWKSLYMINKETRFLGFKPLQWVLISSLLFMTGWFLWWLSLLLMVPLYYTGRKIGRQVSAGHPDPLVAYIVRAGMKTYFTDREGLFNKLTRS